MSIVNRGLLTSVSTQLISLDMWSPVKTYVLPDDAPHIYIDVPCAFIHSCLVLPKLKAEAWLWILGIHRAWSFSMTVTLSGANQAVKPANIEIVSPRFRMAPEITLNHMWVLGVCPQSATSNSPRCHHCLEAKCWSGVSSLWSCEANCFILAFISLLCFLHCLALQL